MKTQKLKPQDAAAFFHTIRQTQAKQRLLLDEINQKQAEIDDYSEDGMEEAIQELSTEIDKLRKQLIDLALDMKNAGLKTNHSLKHLSKP